MRTTRSPSVKTVFLILFSAVFGLTLLILGTSYASQQTGKAVEAATESGYRSFLLATELRQSPDPLTRLAMRSLAQQSSESTQQIRQLIQDSVAKVAAGSELARHLVEAVGVFKLESTDQKTARPEPALQPRSDEPLQLTDGTITVAV